MTIKRFSLILLAVLTALMMAGCGRVESSSQESSDTIEMQTWGDTVDPAATPSMGQVLPDVQEPTESVGPAQSGTATTIDGQDNATETPQPSQTAAPTATPTAAPTKAPSSTTTAPSASPSNSPSIAPPAPASSATIDDVQRYVGKSLRSLIEELGYPISSDYELVDEEDPSQGETGTLFFTGFTATTLRTDDDETVTSVTPTTSEE